MKSLVTWLDPQPPPEALPRLMPSPFDDTPPHPVAAALALELQATLRAGEISPGLSTALLHRPEGGKMFGVLVVRAPSGKVGSLKAFSGQLGGGWEIDGYVPPLFDREARQRLEPASDVAVKRLTAELEALARSPKLAQARKALASLEDQLALERSAAKARLLERQEARRVKRLTLAEGDESARRALGAESRRDDSEHRARQAAWRASRALTEAPLRRLERRLQALERLRRIVSQESMRQIHDTYLLTSASGKTTTLRALFAPGEPPWGTGDCAAPKLLGHALAHGLTPLALAEFWWGPPPPSGARQEGMFFPACKEKCGPLLPFLLDGVPLAPRHTWRPRRVAEEELTTVHEDERIVVVLKPAGLLSVPARDEAVDDSVWARLRRRYPSASGPLLVHRLDLDTSGLLVAALDEEAFRLVQAQFVSRSVRKTYAAWLEGALADDEGEVSLPMRVDLEQRPRQVVDFVHGREALTRWRVLERAAGRTRVALFPLTGRTHQLRVHAAHRQGLDAPIVGDRLYGTPGPRLLLHAESLRLRHPDGADLDLSAPAPF